MTAAHSAFMRKFTELAFDESAETRWQEPKPPEADNIDVGPATKTDLQSNCVKPLCPLSTVDTLVCQPCPRNISQRRFRREL
jgi:hypothetical protein